MTTRGRIGRRTLAAATAVLALALVGGVAASPSLADPGSAETTASAPRWRPIAPAPIAGRLSAATVWTGTEMLVWGGYTRGPGSAFAVNRDGALYDPATDTWRRIRNAPAGVRGGGGDAAAWTGDLAIVWAGNAPDGPARGAVYDPATDTWRTLPRGPLGPREGYVSAWTGDELLIVGGTSGDAFASPVAAAVTADGRWRPLPALNALEALIPSGAAWDGERLFVSGWWFHCPELGSTCTDAEPVVLAYDPGTDELTTLDPPIAAPRVVGVTGGDVVAVAVGRRTRTFVYEPAAGAWRTGARGPCRALRDGAQLAWIGDRLVQACGDRRLQLYDPAADAWTTVLAGGSVFNRFGDSAVAWTGRRLIAWSGVAFRRFNPTPNAGARIVLRG